MTRKNQWGFMDSQHGNTRKEVGGGQRGKGETVPVVTPLMLNFSFLFKDAEGGKKEVHKDQKQVLTPDEGAGARSD